MKNGNIIAIKDINLGDILENGSVVHSTMKIDNKNNKEDLYCIKEKGVNKENIYVTVVAEKNQKNILTKGKHIKNEELIDVNKVIYLG